MMKAYYEEEVKKIQEYLTRLGYSPETVKSYIKNLKYFFNWLQKNHIQQITQEIINKYLEYLHKQPIKSKTIQSKYNVIKHYNKYLENTTGKNILTKSLELQDIDLPKKTDILSVKEIKKLYEVTEETIKGYLDKAILAIYYGCGLRCTEGLRLDIKDINYEKELIHVKAGKNYKNRYIPMSTKVKVDLLNYHKHSRPYLLNAQTTKLLVNIRGLEMNKTDLRKIIKRLSLLANIEKSVTLHKLRHSIATHLLEHGMQLEQISQFLGHKSIQTTQMYTHILKS